MTSENMAYTAPSPFASRTEIRLVVPIFSNMFPGRQFFSCFPHKGVVRARSLLQAGRLRNVRWIPASRPIWR